MRPEFTADAPESPLEPKCQWSDIVAVAALVLGVSLLYGARLSLLPLVGEETRWATAARETLAAGDWVVTRQQGQVFAERPPMTVWLMAIGGSARGDVDSIAVRLPSVVAIVLTSLVVFAYTRSFATAITALVAALVYATFGQVLQIGRLGESEATFALFVGASLLSWHLGYVRGWRPILTWSIGFGFAALAALVKGPQAPVYFVAITAAYLAYCRDWSYLFNWQPLFGGFVFAAIIAAWQIPFYLRTDWQHVWATWAGLAGDRFHAWGMLIHAVTYPIETFACLLPWSPMLVALAWPSVRRRVFDRSPAAEFLIIAMLVAYPTVWFAAGARGRYFMPLYPLAAVLVGLVIETCATAPRGSAARRAWHRFLLLISAVIGATGLFVSVRSWLPKATVVSRENLGFDLLFASMSAVAVIAIWSAFRKQGNVVPLRAALAIAVVVGLGAVGPLMNSNARKWSDPTEAVAGLASLIPNDSQLVSLTPIDHRFAYYYGKSIRELGWPRTVDDVPADVEYFCFMRWPGDTAIARAAGRGRTVYTTPGTLPFAWEEVTAICSDRRPDLATATFIVLGRVVRPIRAEVSDVTKPRVKAASQPPATQRK